MLVWVCQNCHDLIANNPNRNLFTVLTYPSQVPIRAQERSEQGGGGGSHSELDCLFASGSNSCSSDSVFATLFCTVVERASCRVHKLLRTGGSRLLNIYCSGGGWRSLRSLRVGAQRRAIHKYPTSPHPLSPVFISRMWPLWTVSNMEERKRQPCDFVPHNQ